MFHYFDIIIRSVFLENLPLSFFLGMCTFLAISKQVKTAIGLGSAVLFLQIITVPINNLILNYLLKPGAPNQNSMRLLTPLVVMVAPDSPSIW